MEDGHVVQDAVGQTAGDDSADGQLRIAVGLDQNLHIIRDDEADGKGRKAGEIVLGVGQRDPFRPQQLGHRLQEEED